MSDAPPDPLPPQIALALALRREGADTEAIARACGVGVSTVYRWARAHGFRVRDLDAAAWAASGRGVKASVPHLQHGHPKTPILGSDGKIRSCHDAEERREDGKIRSCHDEAERREDGKIRSCHDAGWRREDGKIKSCHDAAERRGDGKITSCHDRAEAGDDAPDISPAQWRQMARSLKQRALALTEAGRLRQADQALRLAERYDRLAGASATAAPVGPERPLTDCRAELEARLDRLAAHLRAEHGLAPDEDFTDAQRAAILRGG